MGKVPLDVYMYCFVEMGFPNGVSNQNDGVNLGLPLTQPYKRNPAKNRTIKSGITEW